MTIIGHLDMDAFFAAVEELRRPELRGFPVVVGSDPREGRGRGVVATANYPAREYGIHSAMPISQAWRLSENARWRGLPPAVFCRGSGREYSKISDRIVKIIESYIHTVEKTSIDEAYFDLSEVGSWQGAVQVARQVKDNILRQERLFASVGVGPNKMVAKIASDADKPDGFRIVQPEQVESFLDPLSIRVIPGIGPKTEMKFHHLGISTVRDLKCYSRYQLHELLGKWGDVLYYKARGQYDTPLRGPWVPKSLGEQRTFFQDTLGFGYLYQVLKELSRDVWRRFERHGFRSYRTVVLTVRFADFETLSRARTLPEAAAQSDTMLITALILLAPFLDLRANPRRKQIRMLGLRIEKLS